MGRMSDTYQNLKRKMAREYADDPKNLAIAMREIDDLFLSDVRVEQEREQAEAVAEAKRQEQAARVKTATEKKPEPAKPAEKKETRVTRQRPGEMPEEEYIEARRKELWQTYGIGGDAAIQQASEEWSASAKELVAESIVRDSIEAGQFIEADANNIFADPKSTPEMVRMASEYMTKVTFAREVESAKAVPAETLAEIEKVVNQRWEDSRVSLNREDHAYDPNADRERLIARAKEQALVKSAEVEQRGPKPFTPPKQYSNASEKLADGFAMLQAQLDAEAKAEAPEVDDASPDAG